MVSDKGKNYYSSSSNGNFKNSMHNCRKILKKFAYDYAIQQYSLRSSETIILLIIIFFIYTYPIFDIKIPGTLFIFFGQGRETIRNGVINSALQYNRYLTYFFQCSGGILLVEGTLIEGGYFNVENRVQLFCTNFSDFFFLHYTKIVQYKPLTCFCNKLPAAFLHTIIL